MAVFPVVGEQPSGQISYREYGFSGVPYVGDPELFTRKSFAATTAMAVRSGFGNFDTAKVDQICFGRTLQEVLSKAAAGEFKIVTMREQWVTCEKFGVRVMQYVQWVEYSRQQTAELVRGAQRQTISVSAGR
jgi:hypothetical protein